MEANDLVAAFLSWEREKSLQTITANDFPIWLLVREELFWALTASDAPLAVLSQEARPRAILQTRQTVTRAAWFLLKSLAQRIGLGPADVLILSSPALRRVTSHGAAEDRRFDGLLRRNPSWLVYEQPDYRGGVHASRPTHATQLLLGDADYLFEYLSVPVTATDAERTVVEHYLSFADRIGVRTLREDIIRREVHRRVQRHLRRLPVYRRLMRRLHPRVLALTSFYSPGIRVMIRAAREIGAHIVDLQHGHIYPGHIGYRYSPATYQSSDAWYLPDRALVFSRYYKQTLKTIGWPGNRVITVGNAQWSGSAPNSDLETRPRTGGARVLVISQYTILDQILAFLKPLAHWPEIEFTVKLHPKELGRGDYVLEYLGHPPNLRIADAEDIMTSIASADACLGVYSTGLIDGLAKGVPGWVMPLEGHERMTDLIKDGTLRIAADLDSFIRELAEHGLPQGSGAEPYDTYQPALVEAVIMAEVAKTRV